jgi:hypothetical protein
VCYSYPTSCVLVRSVRTMHYVPGHEVAAHITHEVKHLAYSTSIPWTVVRETEDSGSYCCQVGDIVATKLVGLFDCAPEVIS